MPTLIALREHPALQRQPDATRIFWAEALEITPDIIRRNHPPTGAFILDA